jgi:hypothetical protein
MDKARNSVLVTEKRLMMEKDFVPSREAFELKQLGFDYSEAPLYQQAFRWFREKHLLDGLVLPQDKSIPDPLPIYFIAIESYENGVMSELFNSTDSNNMLHYSEYEEGELACLQKLIEIVKNRKQKK